MSNADRRLSEESEQRFPGLSAHLLVNFNDRFEVIEEIETVADLEQHYTGELLPPGKARVSSQPNPQVT